MEIRIEHLTKRYPAGTDTVRGEVLALDDLTLTVPDGRITALFGPSGCGKTTALRLICGLEKPDGGRILFGDLDVTALPPEQRATGMVFQDHGLYPHMTVYKNILFPLENLPKGQQLTKGERDLRVREAAERLRIGDLLDARPDALSGGLQQRVALARALARRPEVLLLDEPFTGLDDAARAAAREEVLKVQRETGVTAVLVTHDREDVAALADCVAVLENGRLQRVAALL